MKLKQYVVGWRKYQADADGWYNISWLKYIILKLGGYSVRVMCYYPAKKTLNK